MRYLVGVMAGIVVMIMLGGCAGKFIYTAAPRNYMEPDKYIIMITSIENINEDYEHIWGFQLQATSEYGLKHGYRYFAIVLPSILSNTKGKLYNSYQEVYKVCNDDYEACGGVPMAGPNWEVSYFKKQPNGIITYDGKQILSYLKQNNLYLVFPKNKDVTIDLWDKSNSFDEIAKVAELH